MQLVRYVLSLLLITLTYYRKEPAQLNLNIQSNCSEESISNQWNTSVQSIHQEVSNEMNKFKEDSISNII